MYKNHLIAIAIIGGFILTVNRTLGERNNNPLNIRYNRANDWVGQTGEHKGFVVFNDPKYGFRAGAKILASYKRRGIDTLSEIINTFAPPSENETKNYINFISRQTGIEPNGRVNALDYPILLKAMSKMETGKNWDLSLIMSGVKLA